MLRTGSLAARHAVPMLGINLGRLGFLGEVQPDDWPEALERVLAGDCWLEERMMLHVEHWRGGQLLEQLRSAQRSRGRPRRAGPAGAAEDPD